MVSEFQKSTSPLAIGRSPRNAMLARDTQNGVFVILVPGPRVPLVAIPDHRELDVCLRANVEAPRLRSDVLESNPRGRRSADLGRTILVVGVLMRPGSSRGFEIHGLDKSDTLAFGGPLEQRANCACDSGIRIQVERCRFERLEVL